MDLNNLKMSQRSTVFKPVLILIQFSSLRISFHAHNEQKTTFQVAKLDIATHRHLRFMDGTRGKKKKHGN
jgi:hypothetical protein